MVVDRQHFSLFRFISSREDRTRLPPPKLLCWLRAETPKVSARPCCTERFSEGPAPAPKAQRHAFLRKHQV